MSLKDSITELISPVISQAGFYLEDVQVATPGKHRIITVIVDGDSSLTMDQVTLVTRMVSDLLDSAKFLGESPFTLEVTSPGIDRPLTQPRHWKKNIGRLVKVVLTDGSEAKGRIIAADGSAATLDSATVKYDEVKRAHVEIEFKKVKS